MSKLKRTLFNGALAATFVLAALATTAHDASAHCQVPCGIYDDGARINAMLEDVATIAKATKQVNALAGQVKAGDANALNQSGRWIATKETHASRIIATVSEYFLTQKLKPASPKDKAAWSKYTEALVAHHTVMRLAMKSKQGVDDAVVQQLQVAVQKLGAFWPHKH